MGDRRSFDSRPSTGSGQAYCLSKNLLGSPRCDLPIRYEDRRRCVFADFDQLRFIAYCKVRDSSRFDKRVRSWRLNKHLKEHLIKSDSQEECSICLESYQERDKIVQLTCNHIFHKDCIREWLQIKQNNCPLCRLPVRLLV